MTETVRKIVLEDLDAIGKIYIDAFGHDKAVLKVSNFDQYVQYFIDAGYAYILETEGQAQAFILGYERPSIFDGRTAYIELLAVLPAAQHKGYGKRLIKKFIDTAKEKGIKEVTVSTACYKDAYLVYRNLGFVDSRNDLRLLFKRI